MILLLQGCCGPYFLSKKAGSLPAPRYHITQNSQEDVARTIDQRADALRTFRGLFETTLHINDQQYRFSTTFIYEKPSQFRIETLGAFDIPAIILTGDAQTLVVYSKNQDVAYHGSMTRTDFRNITGIPYSSESFMALLSGNIPRLPHVNYEWGFSVPSVDLYFIERISSQNDYGCRLWFDLEQQHISHIEEYILSTGIITMQAEFSAYRQTSNTPYAIPTEVHIHFPQENVAAEVDMGAFIVNLPMADANLFHPTYSTTTEIRQIPPLSNDTLEFFQLYEEFQTAKQ